MGIMENTRLKYYIKWVRGISTGQAAKELGCARQYLSKICNGHPAGKALAIRIANWSNGYLSIADLMKLPGK